MDTAIRKSMSRTTPMLAIGLIFIAAFAWFRRANAAASPDTYANYSLVYALPSGWKEIPHSPQAIFLFRSLHSDLLMRGAMNDVVADYNPTPDLDRDGLAQWMLDITAANLKSWKGEMLDTVNGTNGTTFRLVRRWSPDKCVVSAIAVRGNTSIVVTLSGDERKVDILDQEMPAFRTYLTTLGMSPHVYKDSDETLSQRPKAKM
ncbi:hypothetical protein [Fimbriimonas ginsengisoli]|uniref:Uncharacterized protein n=1 Tax=Fimbriimonas ginsengisoli Gsoil 348 TaxID=661478 RepID=A0A068NXH5_FIMGI|nr:hypothetical protein [Fimbriimonas ginsengisoli]AIE88121.1 hypothetical protein OP10G_4753 [Fimbriimonas ginsengisoli Gsoil 348]